MKKQHPKTGSPLLRIAVMIAASVLCAMVLLIVPAKYGHLYAEKVLPAFKLPVILGSDAKDNLNALPKPVVSNNMTVAIHADHELRFMTAKGGTVADVPQAAGITLGKTDLCAPSPETPVADGMKIVVSRVTYEEVVTTTEIPFTTVRQNDPMLTKGVTKVAQEGKKGEKTTVTRIMKINGKVVSEQVLSTTVTKAAVNKIVKVGTRKPGAAPFYGLDDVILKQQKYVGTGPVPGTTHWRASVSGNTITDQFGNKVKFVKKITGSCTAYFTAGEITSKGFPCQYGIVAVDPREIPYGTRMFVCSPDGSFVYGYCVAGDTGGFIYNINTVLDLRYNSSAQCWDFFGRRNMCVYILE
jgi:3D (Asp-Asp-Asp) domain-containing protein